jgi:hypothetical protein
MVAISSIPALLEMSILNQQNSGDMDGAWGDVLVAFRVARQCSGTVPLEQARAGLNCERVALSRAMVWAADSRQTPERLGSALDTYLGLPPMPDAAETIRAEAQIIKNTQQLPRAELVERLFEMRSQGSKPLDLWMHKLWVDFITTPWELARTGKAFRLLYASKIIEAQPDPSNAGRPYFGTSESFFQPLIIKAPSQVLSGASLEQILNTTPLVQTFFPLIDSYLQDRQYSTVEGRAFVQILALRIWQLRHNGRLPGKLHDLVTSSLLDRLPTDPYAPGHSFGYVLSSGQSLLPLGERSPVHQSPHDLNRLRPTPGARLLYSVGPDRRDDGAANNTTSMGRGDLIFPLEESITRGQAVSPQ